MKALEYPVKVAATVALALLVASSASVFAQVPVDDDGNVIGRYKSTAAIMPIGNEDIPRLSSTELQELVGPIALYPDDLLAIVLPASAYPLQIIDAARFLEALKDDPTLQPNPEWDDSIVALLNYPEVIELLNGDIDWTWRLGEAVVAHQDDVVAAVETFRDRAYAAGNLKSDSYQTVSRDEGIIEITPIAEDVIYVPYYEPARVVVYQTRPAYYYHPHPYPVYYYPYDAGHYFDRGFFWGVTTAFSIGWHSDSLHVYHHSYRGHPYYGHSYRGHWWYRQPSIRIHNSTYVSHTNGSVNHHSNGDRWHARENRHEFVVSEGYSHQLDRSTHNRQAHNGNDGVSQRRSAQTRQFEPITFRERPAQQMTLVRHNDREQAVRQTHVRQSRQVRRQEPVTRTAREVHARNEPRRTESRRAEHISTQRESRSNKRADRPERRQKKSRARSRH
ncbi:MAG: DUF3300 domain-containing protein [Proteobacteria bacterium]|nr:DUF3300 domain-containing protein [Pseudomonadota bacterium]